MQQHRYSTDKRVIVQNVNSRCFKIKIRSYHKAKSIKKHCHTIESVENHFKHASSMVSQMCASLFKIDLQLMFPQHLLV